MINYRSLRSGTGLLAMIALLIILSLQLSGCSNNDDPTTAGTPAPPVMPEAEQLAFNFSFFAPADGLDKANSQHDHFLNAYLRTVLLDATGRLVLAAPVSAFSAAVHNVPEVEADGTWVWNYKWRIGPETVTIVLRGLPVGEVVQWDLSLIPEGSTQEYLWFFGSSSAGGQEGHWTFHDLDSEDFPICGEISWGQVDGGHFLSFLSLEPDSHGDLLRFMDQEPEFSIEFTPGIGSQGSFIRWHSDGHGSLRVPDYNEGLVACWDQYQLNILCP